MCETRAPQVGSENCLYQTAFAQLSFVKLKKMELNSGIESDKWLNWVPKIKVEYNVVTFVGIATNLEMFLTTQLLAIPQLSCREGTRDYAQIFLGLGVGGA